MSFPTFTSSSGAGELQIFNKAKYAVHISVGALITLNYGYDWLKFLSSQPDSAP